MPSRSGSIRLQPPVAVPAAARADLPEQHALGAATREWLVGPRQVQAFEAVHIKVAGYSEARAGYAFVRHNPAFAQILACVAGEGAVLVQGQWRPCRPGEVYLTPPRSLCAYHILPRRRWDVCWVLYESFQPLPGLEPGGPPRLVCADGRGLHLAIEGLCHEAGASSASPLLEYWATLVHRQALRILQPTHDDPRLIRLWAAVRQDLGGDWTLTRMADVAGMSPESLRRACQARLSTSPLAHATRLRMDFAADLLICSDEKVASIAERVGYGDEFAFSSAFKRHWGIPPSRYRTNSRQTAGKSPARTARRVEPS